ncbi:hypothetical protein AB0N65_11765 [Paenarthrobacter sp. NPDC089322]|uniref:hypothetical protein n=1 Tax=Paenarthrobacter sp. NPDC089322 TaxID=3155065 RepID=UPI0034336584
MSRKCKYGLVKDPAHATMPSRQLSKLLGISKSAINDCRSGNCICEPVTTTHPATTPVLTGKADVRPDGGEFIDVQTEQPVTDWAHIFQRFNLDPAEFAIVNDTVRCATWQQSKALEDGSRDVVNLYSYRAQFTRKRAEDRVDLPALYAAAKTATPQPLQNGSDRATIVVWADPQIGKTGSRGGTKELIERSTIIRQKLDALLAEREPDQIMIADAGDGIEGFESGGNPMFTNDLSLSAQLDTYGTELFEYINLAHYHAPVTVAAVPSNHAAWRNSKQQLGRPGDDLGLFMHKQVARVTAATKMAVNWVSPTEYDESVAVDFYGTKVGLVHGNQFGPGQAVAWWQRQAFGAQAVASSDVLVFGHYHSFSAAVAGRNPVNGRQRYCLGAPTLDNGSDWFRQTQGRDSDPGVLVFDVTPEGFDLASLTIITA